PIAPSVPLPSQVAPPDLMPLHVVSEQSCRSEPGDDQVSVSDGGGRSVRVRGMSGLHLTVGHAGLPEQLPTRPVETHKRSAVLILDCLGYKDAVFPDHWS